MAALVAETTAVLRRYLSRSRNRRRFVLARRVFFSFHFQRDIFRVNTVRNSDVTKKGIEQSGYWDHSLWEETKKKGDAALQKLINDGLTNTSVTVALAGTETSQRKWVRYELVKSFERGNGLMTVYINQVKDISAKLDTRGVDPLAHLYFTIASGGSTASIQHAVNGQLAPYMTINATSLPAAAKTAGKGLLSIAARSYDWVGDEGYTNFGKWVEAAATAAGR